MKKAERKQITLQTQIFRLEERVSNRKLNSKVQWGEKLDAVPRKTQSPKKRAGFLSQKEKKLFLGNILVDRPSDQSDASFASEHGRGPFEHHA